MEPVARSTNDEQADHYFAGLVNPTPAQIAAVVRERHGDIAAVVAEQKAYGYWQRNITARATRRTERERDQQDDHAQRLAALHRTPNETARRAPLPAISAAMLPEARTATLTDAERTETQRWWHRLDTRPPTSRGLIQRCKKEARDAQIARKRAARAAATWRLEQRAFERTQWRTAIARRLTRPQRQWIAIDEQRALQIAMDVLEKQHPPQEPQ